MPDLFHLTPEMNQYFNALPESVKENIIQSGAKINSLEERTIDVKRLEVTAE